MLCDAAAPSHGRSTVGGGTGSTAERRPERRNGGGPVASPRGSTEQFRCSSDPSGPVARCPASLATVARQGSTSGRSGGGLCGWWYRCIEARRIGSVYRRIHLVPLRSGDGRTRLRDSLVDVAPPAVTLHFVHPGLGRSRNPGSAASRLPSTSGTAPESESSLMPMTGHWSVDGLVVPALASGNVTEGEASRNRVGGRRRGSDCPSSQAAVDLRVEVPQA